MSTLFPRASALLVDFGVLIAVASGCAVTDGGYGYEGGGLGVGYYEPYGAVYGGWAPGYQVAPFRGGDMRGRGGGGGGQHAFRPAGVSRSMPSIPSGSRSGGHGRR